MTNNPVIIAGGGIGGLASAVALQRVGIRAAVFEKVPEIAEAGAGLVVLGLIWKAQRRD